MYDPSVRPAADLSSFAVTGLFGQVKWDISRRLSLVGGARVDMTESGNPPALQPEAFQPDRIS
jgi:outer membrane receptor protein involved in Fe transport